MNKTDLLKLVCTTVLVSIILFICAFRISKAWGLYSGMDIKNITFKEKILLPVPVFKQWDPNWSKDKIGGSNEQIINIGCTLCCTAMVFDYFGVETTPKTLNSHLRSNDGYTENGWLCWYNAAEFTKGKIGINYIGGPNHTVIEDSLKNKIPVIVKVLLPGGIQHWVVIVGKNKDGYLVNDPLGAENGPIPLSTIADKIYSMRIFKPVSKK